jgi:hypothetical protein
LPPDVADHITAPPSFMVKRWNSVKMDPYRKKAYFAVQQMFAPAPAETAVTPQPRNRAALPGRNGAIGR